MTQDQEKILEQFSNDTILYFLKEKRNMAFVTWETSEVISIAKKNGFKMSEDIAIDILSDIDRIDDRDNGITWETIENSVNDWIKENTYEVTIKEIDTGEERVANFCSIKTNQYIEDFWNDDEYYFYGISSEELSKFTGKEFVDGSCIIVSI